MCHNSFTRSSVIGHLGCFHVLAAVNRKHTHILGCGTYGQIHAGPPALENVHFLGTFLTFFLNFAALKYHLPHVCFAIRTVTAYLCCVYHTREHPPVNSRSTSFAHSSAFGVQLPLCRDSSRTCEIKPCTATCVSTYLPWGGHASRRSSGSSPLTYIFQC